MKNNLLNLKNRIRYYLNRFAGLASIVLQPVEKYLSRKYRDDVGKEYSSVFIVGAPRCGSTLLYKILTEQFEFSYFTNFNAKFYSIPICGSLLQKVLGITARKGDYDFNYGQVRGLGSPSECGEFWYRWFPRGLHVYVAPGKTPTRVLKELRSEIGGISAVNKRPVIFKNLYNSMRIAPIVEALPDAVFIVCRRDHIDNAFSILKGRTNDLSARDRWWSLPPKEIDYLANLSWAEQIAGQVYYTYQQIEEDKERFGTERFIEIKYEEFCMDVHSSVTKIEEFLADKGCYLEKRGEVPKRFQAMGVDGIDPEDKKTLMKAVQNLIQSNNK